eukprot:TRINITY_DN1714_c0_g1_i1.p1 TRINITY_DN1714_c0_g1~~TRINITY_DN1714_c0_g1_i1.p1  ORF type:complete len:421 (-),score=123.30 TRINITY_DN1714_c0_g1_i1:587-1849(-)
MSQHWFEEIPTEDPIAKVNVDPHELNNLEKKEKEKEKEKEEKEKENEKKKKRSIDNSFESKVKYESDTFKLNAFNLNLEDLCNFEKIITSPSTLKVLELPSCILSPIVFTKIFSSLITCSTLTELNLHNNLPDNNASKVLANFLKKNLNLQVLRLSRSLVGIAEIETDQSIIFESIATLTQLKILDLCAFIDTRYNGNELTEALKKLENLEQLELASSTFNASFDFNSLLLALNNCFKLKILNFSGCKLYGNYIQALSSFIRYNHSIIFINLSKNNLNSEHLKLLQPAINLNTSIQFLSFRANLFNNSNCESAIAKIISTNASIIDLNLTRCKLQNITNIPSNLRENCVLKRINLTANNIAEKSISSLLNDFIHCPSLIVADLRFNNGKCKNHKRESLVIQRLIELDGTLNTKKLQINYK